MHSFMNIVTFGFILILIYILVSNFAGTVAIGSMVGKDVPPIIQSLQGVGTGYPAPAR